MAWPPEESAAAVPFLAAPVCLPAKKHAYALPADAVLPACLPAKEVASTCERVHEPGPRQKGTPSVPICLPANKRVMRPPSMDSDGSRFGTAKEARPQGSNKHGGGAIIPRANAKDRARSAKQDAPCSN